MSVKLKNNAVAALAAGISTTDFTPSMLAGTGGSGQQAGANVENGAVYISRTQVPL